MEGEWELHVNVLSHAVVSGFVSVGGSTIEASDAVSDDDKGTTSYPRRLLGRVGFVHGRILLKAETATIGICTSGACARDVQHDNDEQHVAAINTTTIRPATEDGKSPPLRCVLRRRIIIVWFFPPLPCKQIVLLDHALVFSRFFFCGRPSAVSVRGGPGLWPSKLPGTSSGDFACFAVHI